MRKNKERPVWTQTSVFSGELLNFAGQRVEITEVRREV